MVDSQCKKQKRTYLQAVFQKKTNKGNYSPKQNTKKLFHFP